ncbi:hypothetical protein BKA63DRAFT_312452 [Paraphoma chrysanthemicola]|nr:hypothetical protein BKA63DRAFT_312452 [Paraphoma chrysanthemicola]
MGYSTALTEWPSLAVPQAVKDLIDKLFATMDLNDPRAGDILADEIFTVDGLIDGRHKAQGSEALRKCRDNVWTAIHSRKHELLKVYVSSETCEDILAIGQVTIGYKNGEKKIGEFIARLLIHHPQSAASKLKLYNVWMDIAAMQKIK